MMNPWRNSLSHDLERQNILHTSAPIEMFRVDGQLEAEINIKWLPAMFSTTIVSEQQLRQAGVEIEIPNSHEAVLHDASTYWLLKTMDVPFGVKLTNPEKELTVSVGKVGEGNVFNAPISGTQLVVEDVFYHELIESIPE